MMIFGEEGAGEAREDKKTVQMARRALLGHGQWDRSEA
jgi:hypothetical protein